MYSFKIGPFSQPRHNGNYRFFFIRLCCLFFLASTLTQSAINDILPHDIGMLWYQSTLVELLYNCHSHNANYIIKDNMTYYEYTL